MEVRWNPYEIQLSCFMVLAVLSEIRECDSLNLEGLALLEFRDRIEDDPYRALLNWNSNHTEPCLWLGVHCVDGKVQMLDLGGFSLQGTLAPGLRKLRYMKSIVLSNNSLSGGIPKEIGELKLLELLDLRYNNLTGDIPCEIGGMPSLKCLLLFGNNFQGGFSPELEKFDPLGNECRWNHESDVMEPKDCKIKKSGQCIWQSMLNQMKSYINSRSIVGRGCWYADAEKCSRNLRSSLDDETSRRLLVESSNLFAAPSPAHVSPPENMPVALSSGTFPAHLNYTTWASNEPLSNQRASAYNSSKRNWIVILFSVVLLFSLFTIFLYVRQYRSVERVHAQDTNLLHRLSKVFVTGVPKLNSSELQTACEDFSNIIDTFSGCLMYKGILSSGVEIAVLSTSIRSSRHWSNHAEREFKKKIDSFSRINHKNFVNLLGFCEEEDPFVRMMVFEYAPNGNVYEHLHVPDSEHLDWNARLRIIMGTCYCLEYMHHELQPPVVLPSIQSDSILLTDDYAAKIADVSFWADIAAKSEIPDEQQYEDLASSPVSTIEDNICSFGILLLEIISAKSPSIEEVSLVNWASRYLCDEKQQYKSLVDPSLKFFREHELEVICDVIRDCINEDPKRRPTMRTITSKLRSVINISPEAATSRFSPLWWAELEILSECT